MTMLNQKIEPFELPSAQGELHNIADDFGSWQLLVFHRHLG